MTKLFRFVSMLVVLVMVLGIFAAPMNGTNQVSAQKEVPTFVVAPTEVPTEEPVVEPTEPPVEEPEGEVPTEPVEEATPVPTEAPEVVPLIEAAADVAVPGRYIVVFKDGADKAAARQSALALIAAGGGRVAFEYDSALDGLAAEFSPEVLRKLRQDARIDFIEMDQKVTVHQEEVPFSAQSFEDPAPSWGLDRIDQVSKVLDNRYTYPSIGGRGVHVYILDSGIRNTHEQYIGRVFMDFDSVQGANPKAYDCAGHGTHVAGTAGGNTVGVAHLVQLHSVRVLDCSGTGYTSQIIAGINYVAKNHIKPAVANMSLGGGASPSEDAAINAAISKGVTFIVAAGNSNDDACYYSPARVPAAITVGATGNTDARAGFSNYGKCVDIFAPGVDIYSSVMTSNTSYDGTWDGTSMATPHVTGVAALYLAANPAATPAQVTAYLLNNALVGAVGSPGTGSPNRLLHIPTNIATGPTLVYPAADQVIAQKQPDFKWKYVTNTDMYYLQITANDPTFTTILNGINTDGNHFQYSDVLIDGTYYWRVQAQSVDPTKRVWSAPRKFKVDTTGPNAPVLTFPAANATVNGIPTFKWLASPSAKKYRVAYDLDNSADDSFEVIFPETAYLYFKPASLPDTKFVYWYVQAKDALGNWGEWSDSRQVWINPLKPAAPKLLTPANNFSTNDQTPDFTWSEVLYDDYYQIQISTNTSFTNIVDSWEQSNRTYTSISLNEGKYYWRVRAKNTGGILGYWSAYRTLYIDLTPPAAPNPTGPANGGNVTGTPFFSWSIPAGVKTYSLEFGNTPGFDDETILYTGIKTNSYKPVPVIPVGDWFWRVLAIDAAGNAGVYGPARLVHVNPALPGKPSLVKPAVGSYTDQSTVEFEWTAANYADTYHIQFDNNSDFSSLTFMTESNPGLLTASINIGFFSPGKYYWRVRGVNVNGGKGPWSASRSFTYSLANSFGFDTLSELGTWTEHPGGDWDVNTSSGYAYTDGILNSENTSSMSYPVILSNFTVQSRIKMDAGSGGADGGYFGIVVRGTPTFDSYGDWTKAYYFGLFAYTDSDTGIRHGCFNVYKMPYILSNRLAGFCDTAILPEDWNDLKVVAVGSQFKFYINNYLVWQGSNSAYTSGRVGVFTYPYIGMSGVPGRTYVDSFSIGAPITGTSITEDVLQPDLPMNERQDPYIRKFD